MGKTNFDDVGDFHQKFELDSVTHRGTGPRPHVDDLLRFRTNFMLEELKEFAVASGYILQGGKFVFDPTRWRDEITVDHEKAFDALLDLAYVVFGTAHLLGYPWQHGWDEVQRANMTKERCGIDHTFQEHPKDYDVCIHIQDGRLCGKPAKAHSARGSAYDVIKPVGWEAPSLKKVLKDAGFDLKG